MGGLAGGNTRINPDLGVKRVVKTTPEATAGLGGQVSSHQASQATEADRRATKPDHAWQSRKESGSAQRLEQGIR